MATIFVSGKDNAYDVEIAGVGIVAAGKGGVPAERAALRVRELQDDDGKPLTGAKLAKAAEKFAEARGLSTKSGDFDEEKLRVESGAFPAGPSIEEISRAAAERQYAFTEAHAPALTIDEVPAQTDLPQPAMPAKADKPR